MLMACWYPTVAEASQAMPYSGYYTMGNAEHGTEFEEFASRLFAYYGNEISEFGLGKEPANLDANEKEILEIFVKTPTQVHGGTPASGPFPLVLYHPGLGSSYFENVILCEYLASHGYVVVSSAYPPADVAQLVLRGDYERSNRDIALLIEKAGTLANVDLEHIGLIGSSYGGHAVTVFQSERASVVDAVVSIDSTMELRSRNQPPWFEPARTRLSRIENLLVPMLLIAGRGISVCLADNGVDEKRVSTFAPRYDVYEELVHAERWYATIANLWHCEFASSGVLWNGIRKPIWANMPDQTTAWDTYRLVNRLILRFLNASLKADFDDLNWLQTNTTPPPQETDRLDSPPLALQYRSSIPFPKPTS
jgi:pimeloyl-ACP methyl ester carboxylesterase